MDYSGHFSKSYDTTFRPGFSLFQDLSDFFRKLRFLRYPQVWAHNVICDICDIIPVRTSVSNIFFCLPDVQTLQIA